MLLRAKNKINLQHRRITKRLKPRKQAYLLARMAGVKDDALDLAID
jgi:hypothetical protein